MCSPASLTAFRGHNTAGNKPRILGKSMQRELKICTSPGARRSCCQQDFCAQDSHRSLPTPVPAVCRRGKHPCPALERLFHCPALPGGVLVLAMWQVPAGCKPTQGWHCRRGRGGCAPCSQTPPAWKSHRTRAVPGWECGWGSLRPTLGGDAPARRETRISQKHN